MVRGRSLAAVLLGVVVLTGLLAVLNRVQVSLPPPEQMPGPSRIVLSTLLLALFSELPAGYLVGRLAPNRPVLHGAVVGVIGALLVGAFIAQQGSTPLIWGLAIGALQIPTILAGAWLAARSTEPS